MCEDCKKSFGFIAREDPPPSTVSLAHTHPSCLNRPKTLNLLLSRPIMPILNVENHPIRALAKGFGLTSQAEL